MQINSTKVIKMPKLYGNTIPVDVFNGKNSSIKNPVINKPV
jgi:hypothetical protein